jgi:hypothetical protein
VLGVEPGIGAQRRQEVVAPAVIHDGSQADQIK